MWCQSPSRQKEGREDGEWGMWQSAGGIRSPSLSWNPYKESEARCSNRRIHTHRHVMSITLPSVVNKRVRCTDYRHTTRAHTHSLQPAAAPDAQGQHLPAEQPATIGQNKFMTYNQSWSKTVGRSAEMRKHLERNHWQGMVYYSWRLCEFVLGGR